MRAKWLKFSILPSIKVRVGGQCIAPKTRTTLILDRYIKLSEKFIGKHGENLQFCRSLENLVVFRNY